MWGEEAALIKDAIYTHANLDVSVTRSGQGSAAENFGFTYAIKFPHSQDNQPFLEVVLHQAASTPFYVPGNVSDLAFQNNDLIVDSLFTGGQDLTFTIEVNVSVTKIGNRTIRKEYFAWSIDNNAQSDFMLIIVGESYWLQDGVNVTFPSINHNDGDK